MSSTAGSLFRWALIGNEPRRPYFRSPLLRKRRAGILRLARDDAFLCRSPTSVSQLPGLAAFGLSGVFII